MYNLTLNRKIVLLTPYLVFCITLLFSFTTTANPNPRNELTFDRLIKINLAWTMLKLHLTWLTETNEMSTQITG